MIKILTGAVMALTLLSGSATAAPITPTPAEQAQLDALHQSDDWFIGHLKGPREIADGVMLDARLQYVLENVTRPASTPAVQTYLRNSYKTPEGRLATRTALDRYWALRTQSAEVASVTDRSITGRGGDIALRIYRPISDKPLPVLVYYHGGGFMFGSLDAFDPTLRRLSAQAGVIVVSVSYRLAPEAPYPAAWSDAEDAFLWTRANLKALGATSVSVGGDSAGATLAIAVALRAKAAHQPGPASLLLYYPGVDLVNDYPSMHAFGTGYGLDADNLKYLADQVYPTGIALPPEDTSPLQADLCGLPQALVVTAGFDPLKDGQKAFAQKLIAANPKSQLLSYPSLIHGFLQTTGYVPAALEAADRSAVAFGDMARHPAAGPKVCK